MDSQQEERLRKLFPYPFAGQISNNLEKKYSAFLRERIKPPIFYTWSKCAQKSVANLDSYLRQYQLPKTKDPSHGKWNVYARLSANRLNTYFNKPRERFSLEWALLELNNYSSLPLQTLKYEYHYYNAAKIEVQKLNNLLGTGENAGKSKEIIDWDYCAKRNSVNLNSYNKKREDDFDYKWKRTYLMNKKGLLGYKNPEWDDKVIGICANLNRIATR
ncbi:hypothetical protein ACE5IS_19615 [Leptospira wolffii]|uniref:Uncharacterized protein n=1 Tax=Leptospira wolffii TaxID=409998 RepID=A0ABV5BTT7_9LEPT